MLKGLDNSHGNSGPGEFAIGPAGMSSIGSLNSKTLLNSLLFPNHWDRIVDENTLPLQIWRIFQDTFHFAEKCSQSISDLRKCQFHFSHPK